MAAKKMKIGDSCKKFMPPYDKWKLAEMALANPTGLNEALSEFPFHTDLSTILKGGYNGRK